MEDLKKVPVLGNILSIIDTFPRISAWVVLSTGVIAILVYEARDVDLTTTNWIALIVASILVSGLCIWIVSWEDEEELEVEAPSTASASSNNEAAPDSPATAEE